MENILPKNGMRVEDGEIVVDEGLYKSSLRHVEIPVAQARAVFKHLKDFTTQVSDEAVRLAGAELPKEKNVSVYVETGKRDFMPSIDVNVAKSKKVAGVVHKPFVQVGVTVPNEVVGSRADIYSTLYENAKKGAAEKA